jgi:integrase
MNDTLSYWLLERYLPQNLKVRDPQTRTNYRHAFRDFAEFLAREPLLSDLSDETLAAFMNWLLDVRQLAPVTVNERAGRLKAFWTWAARKRHVDQFPTVGRVPVPEKIPQAWREDDLVKLFNACRRQRGDICGVPAWRWWFCLHGWLWCTSERIGATMRLRVEDLRLDDRLAIVPAGIRKGKRQPRVYVLWPDLIAMLREILPPVTDARSLVFPWPKHATTFYYDYGKLLRMADLPFDRSSKPHRMRVSHASWRHVAGEDATAALGHRSADTTRRHYLDPTLLKQDESKLFRPW